MEVYQNLIKRLNLRKFKFIFHDKNYQKYIFQKISQLKSSQQKILFFDFQDILHNFSKNCEYLSNINSQNSGIWVLKNILIRYINRP